MRINNELKKQNICLQNEVKLSTLCKFFLSNGSPSLWLIRTNGIGQQAFRQNLI